VKKGRTPKSAATYVAAALAGEVHAAATQPAMAAVPAAGGRYRCTVCGWEYDPAAGDRAGKIPAGTPFAALPETWVCPVCGVGKDMFVEA
jgi:rubredoxin